MAPSSTAIYPTSGVSTRIATSIASRSACLDLILIGHSNPTARQACVVSLSLSTTTQASFFISSLVMLSPRNQKQQAAFTTEYSIPRSYISIVQPFWCGRSRIVIQVVPRQFDASLFVGNIGTWEPFLTASQV